MKKVVLVLVGLLLLALAACGAIFVFVPSATPVSTSATQENDPLAEEAAILQLDVNAVENEAGELVFDCTLDDFIASYNGYYWQDKGRRYLLPAADWEQNQVENTVQSAVPATQYIYTADENVWTLPKLNAYVPENSETLSQVALTYDDHSYSEATYALFEEDCYYTLKVFFPTLSQEQLTTLYETVNQSAYDHTFPSEQQYRPGSAQLPALLYHQNGIGVFGYFAIGAPLRFCVIPVDETLLADYAASGVDVREIE